jgi:hypothetical protein
MNRFELQRVLTMSSPKGVDRIVASLFSAPNVPVGGAVVVSLSLSIERGTATGSAPRSSPQ